MVAAVGGGSCGSGLVLVAGEWLRQHSHTGFAECHKSNRLKGMMIVIVAR